MMLLRRAVLTQDRKRPPDLIPDRDATYWPAPGNGATSVSAGHEAALWAWLDLNQRPHPYQQSRAERCAARRFPWSPPTVRDEVMRSYNLARTGDGRAIVAPAR